MYSQLLSDNEKILYRPVKASKVIYANSNEQGYLLITNKQIIIIDAG